MKKSILKIAVPTLALGLAFAPLSSAASTETTVKTTASYKGSVHLSAKEKEGFKRLTSITKNVSKVEASVTQLSKVTSEFYAKTPVISSKAEAEFYSNVSGKLKANNNQLRSLKKQTDEVVKKFGKTEATVIVYVKIDAQKQAIAAASKKLTDLHNQYKEQWKVKEAAASLAYIQKHIAKVDSNVAQLSKVTSDFYVKAAAGTVSSKAEAEFYSNVSEKLKGNLNHLHALKKQLDYHTKKYGKTDAVTAAYGKITVLHDAINLNSKTLLELHTKFQATVKEKEVSMKLAGLSEKVTKAEVKSSVLLKAATAFYEKAATVSVTAQEEEAFFKMINEHLKSNSYYLVGLKKELDELTKKYGKTEASLALEAKINVQIEAINLTSKIVAELHANFKPAVPTTK